MLIILKAGPQKHKSFNKCCWIILWIPVEVLHNFKGAPIQGMETFFCVNIYTNCKINRNQNSRSNRLLCLELSLTTFSLSFIFYDLFHQSMTGVNRMLHVVCASITCYMWYVCQSHVTCGPHNRMLHVVRVCHWHFICTLILDSCPEGRYEAYRLLNFMQGYWTGLSPECMLGGSY